MCLIQTSIVLPPQMNGPDREDIAGPDSGAAGHGGGAELADLSSGASHKLWGLYVTLAQEEDQEKSVNWIGDSEGILVFVRVHKLQ